MSAIADDEFGCRREWPLLCPEIELHARCVDNAADLSEFVTGLAREWHGSLQFEPAVLLEANRLAMKGIYACAGAFRDQPVVVGTFNPPS